MKCNAGDSCPASLVVLAAGHQRVIICMERRAVVQLRARIGSMIERERAARRSAQPTA